MPSETTKGYAVELRLKDVTNDVGETVEVWFRFAKIHASQRSADNLVSDLCHSIGPLRVVDINKVNGGIKDAKLHQQEADRHATHY